MDSSASCCCRAVWGCESVLMHIAGGLLLRCASMLIPAIVGCCWGTLGSGSVLGCSGPPAPCGLLRMRTSAAAECCFCDLRLSTGCCSYEALCEDFSWAFEELQWAAIGERPSCEVFQLRCGQAVEASGRCRLHRWGHKPRQSFILLFLVSLNSSSQLLTCAAHCTTCTLL